MKQRVTLQDLSKKTGLSQTTISMILGRRTDVSFASETIRIVRDAARELGYQTRAPRRVSLFTRRTILVVCPFLMNHYYSAVAQALQSAAAEMQCNVLVYATYNNIDEEARIIRVMAETDVGGIIFAMMPQSASLVRKIAKTVPVVIIADPDGALPISIIALHNYKAGELMGAHLFELGHKDIIFISTPLSSPLPARIKRFEGLRDAWQRLRPDGSLRLFTNFITNAMVRDNIQMERMLGSEITQGALEKTHDSFTAIVAVNDMLAYGAMDALAAAKVRIPEDCSLCGLDNDFSSDLVGVNLTSVEHFMALNAQEAFRVLYHKMVQADLSCEIRPVMDIQPELVVRQSTAPPNY